MPPVGAVASRSSMALVFSIMLFCGDTIDGGSSVWYVVAIIEFETESSPSYTWGMNPYVHNAWESLGVNMNPLFVSLPVSGAGHEPEITFTPHEYM